MKFFIFNNEINNIELNEPEILLVKEFAKLWNRDKSKYKETANKELTYIWLALDWQSPYSEYNEDDKHKEALIDSGLTKEQFDDPEFRAACRKYRDIQNENWSIKCLKAAQNAMSKFIDYFNNIDPEERDDITRKPIYKVKDIMNEISQLSALNESLKTLEYQVKKEKEQVSSNRGGEIDGFQPTDNEL